MKILTSNYHEYDFGAIKGADKSWAGKAITTKPCVMFTASCKGIPSISKLIPEGTEVRYSIRSNGTNTITFIDVVCGNFERSIATEKPIEEVASMLKINVVK